MQRRKFESILLASDDSSSDFESDDAAPKGNPSSSQVTMKSPLKVLSPNNDVEIIELEAETSKINSPRLALQGSSGSSHNAAGLSEVITKKSRRNGSTSATILPMPNHSKASNTPSVSIFGNDSATPEAEVSHWRSLVAQASSSGQHYIDPDFPPTQLSVDGKHEESTEIRPIEPQPSPDTIPQCRCKEPASSTIVKSDTPNKGRPYYHCKTRRCQFFAWGDGLERSKARKRLKWMRFPMFPVVTDFGFSAADLRQGGVGDCWFMSALAVVAERHDLIGRLFTDTARNAAGCYQVRLFLDGKWRSIVIDDMLPVTDDPRRAELAFESKLAFSRCGSSTGGQQLWVSILEKAYAKAHGSYQAISGGQISEALLDLTGCPTEDIDLSAADLDLEHLWRKLCEFRRLKFPMGCSTDSDPSLREVGLFGSHAYSILDVREARLASPSFESWGSSGFVGGVFGGQGFEAVRLVRIRNPHGVGEFNGDWSDKSAKWSSLLFPCGEGSQGEELERTGVDDGTFWMDWTHFLMGYSRIDVCYAHQDWHCKSLENMFPANQDKLSRLCAKSYLIAVNSEAASRPTTILHVSAIQPTKRGSWCRSDRKKSYRPGGVQLILAKCDASTGSVLSIVQSAFDGADDRATVTCLLENDPRYMFVVFPLCLGQAPTAAESTKLQPFSMRFFAESPLAIHEVTPSSPPSHLKASRDAQLDPNGLFTSPSCAALMALQMALVSPPSSLPSASFTQTAVSKSLSLQLFALPQSSKLKRRIIRGEMGCDLLVARGEGALFLVALHRGVDHVQSDSYGGSSSGSSYLTAAASNEPVRAQVNVMAKSHTARSVAGLVKSNNDRAEKYYLSLPKPDPAQSAGGWRPKWPAKWKAYSADVVLHPNQQAVVLILTKSGMLAELGAIEFCVVPANSDEFSGAAPVQPKALQPTLGKWCQGNSVNSEGSQCGKSRSVGLFSPSSVDANAISTLERCLNQQNSMISLVRQDNIAAEERAIAEAIEASKQQSRDLVNGNDDDIFKAILASTEESNNHCAPFTSDRPVSQAHERHPKEKWNCERCTFVNMPAAHLCEICGFVPSRNEASSIAALEVVDLVEATPEVCVATANQENSGTHKSCEDMAHSDAPHKRAKNEDTAQPTAAEARAACIEARLRRFDR